MGEESSIKDELAANKATWGRSRCTSSGLLLWCATGAAGWAPALALALAICSPCAISVSHARRTLHHAIDQGVFRRASLAIRATAKASAAVGKQAVAVALAVVETFSSARVDK